MKLQHTIIRASAGSGKTYQLANRFIALLLLQEAAGKIAPEKLVAVTFTRMGRVSLPIASWTASPRPPAMKRSARSCKPTSNS